MIGKSGIPSLGSTENLFFNFLCPKHLEFQVWCKKWVLFTLD